MKTLLLVLIVSIAILALSFCFIGIKMFLKKNGEFKSRCANVDPYTGDRSNCVCGKNNVFKDKCDSHHKYNPLEVNKELLEE
ncbi:MAG: hypothetical protein U0M28_00965 [Bacteroidales bacterium]|nr:hypothetical protein [Bacteroidales bacterium]